jgi:ketosteroid isomerase-like protein
MKLIVALGASLLVLAASSAVADTASVQKEITSIETATAKAQVDKDIATLSGIIADDWVAQSEGGKTTKASYLADIKSGKIASTSVKLHDVNIRVFGNIAVAQGEDTEKSTYAGKDVSGVYSWTDVFENRNGKWQLVVSQGSKLAMAQ